ncbi:cAMP-dependent protein kinase inhibitor alpha isoform X2 [Ursus arctos]|uniref:cAMP-dependent protein kinase inhibitor alpha isoform X2 n=1 Tax=Ursus arctos TaxID=9644 RepID=UPI001CF8138F|nr:cAMP-dependent protein kinase inhibitor alpha isoform X2 [Ursus arctos]
MQPERGGGSSCCSRQVGWGPAELTTDSARRGGTAALGQRGLALTPSREDTVLVTGESRMTETVVVLKHSPSFLSFWKAWFSQRNSFW